MKPSLTLIAPLLRQCALPVKLILVKAAHASRLNHTAEHSRIINRIITSATALRSRYRLIIKMSFLSLIILISHAVPLHAAPRAEGSKTVLEYPEYRERAAMARLCRAQPGASVGLEPGYIPCPALNLYWQLVLTGRHAEAALLAERE